MIPNLSPISQPRLQILAFFFPSYKLILVSNLSVSLFSNFFFFFFTTTPLPNPPSFGNQQQQQEGCLDGYGTQKLHPFTLVKYPLPPPPPPPTTTKTTTLHFPNQTNQCPLLNFSSNLQHFKQMQLKRSLIFLLLLLPLLSHKCVMFPSLILKAFSLTHTQISLSLSLPLSLSLFVREVVNKDAIKLGCYFGINANEEGEMGYK